MEKIEFRNVSFTYPNTEKKALDNISFTINPSEFILLCGKSGCGKSTLLRHLKRSIKSYGLEEGEVIYNGVNIDDLDDRVSASDIGFVQQNPDNQIVTDKVWHELAFGLESLGYDTSVIRRRVSEMASFFGIETWFRKSVHELSGGQKQLLNLASIMVMQPKVIVLDEPTSQLDPIASSEFLRTLSKINQELGTTIILSEHRLEEAITLADTVIVMDSGKVVCSGDINTVGEFLSSGTTKHPMFEGLPAIMKIYTEVNSGGNCPITVRDGRIWLNKLLGNEVDYKKIDEPNNIKKFDDKETVIELSDVWFRYDKGGCDIAKGLSFKVKAGELFCLVGGNGVGKSTAIKIITGILKPYRGKTFINNKDIRKKSNKETFNQTLGVVPQNPQSIFTEITVEEELYEMFYDSQMSEDEKLEKIDNILKELQLENMRKMHPYDLSGGEQQRLALGKILLLNPEILLLDEPTKGLDPFLKNIFADILKGLKAKGVTILMVTHDIEFCAENADKCAMFFDGYIISQENPRDFFSGNNFYTTTSNRMSRHLFENAITYKDVVELCVKNMTPKDMN